MSPSQLVHRIARDRSSIFYQNFTCTQRVCQQLSDTIYFVLILRGEKNTVRTRQISENPRNHYDTIEYHACFNLAQIFYKIPEMSRATRQFSFALFLSCLHNFTHGRVFFPALITQKRAAKIKLLPNFFVINYYADTYMSR